ncbi:hypothetical protein ES703_07721 [subsurface metagenome]
MPDIDEKSKETFKISLKIILEHDLMGLLK